MADAPVDDSAAAGPVSAGADGDSTAAGGETGAASAAAKVASIAASKALDVDGDDFAGFGLACPCLAAAVPA
jgi:hypothetical protein